MMTGKKSVSCFWFKVCMNKQKWYQRYTYTHVHQQRQQKALTTHTHTYIFIHDHTNYAPIYAKSLCQTLYETKFYLTFCIFACCTKWRKNESKNRVMATKGELFLTLFGTVWYMVYVLSALLCFDVFFRTIRLHFAYSISMKFIPFTNIALDNFIIHLLILSLVFLLCWSEFGRCTRLSWGMHCLNWNF